MRYGVYDYDFTTKMIKLIKDYGYSEIIEFMYNEDPGQFHDYAINLLRNDP